MMFCEPNATRRIPQDEARQQSNPLGGASDFRIFQGARGEALQEADREGRGRYAKQPRDFGRTERSGRTLGARHPLHLVPGVVGS